MNEHHEKILKKLYDNLEFKQIISYCDEQIKLDKSNYLFFGARGKAFYNLNQLDKAINNISISLELHPNYTQGLFNRAQCYFDLEEYQLAINDIEKSHSLDDKKTFYDLLGLSYLCIDNYKKAIEIFTLCLEDELDNTVLAWRAEAYFCLDKFEEAIKDYEMLLLQDIENTEVFHDIEKINSYDFSNLHSNELIVLNLSSSFVDLGFSILKEEKASGIYIIEFNDSPESWFGCINQGVYILEFSNNEYYVGQTKNIQNRLKQHCKAFNDIKNAYFKSIVETELFNEETKIIAFFEKNLLRIRNLKQIEFSNIFDESCQKLWLSDLRYNYLSGNKFDNQAVRTKFSDRFKILQNNIYFPRLINFLSVYLKSSIPNYIASEYNYWSITCLPKHLAKDNCISRININTVPVLSAYKNTDDSLNVMLFVSKLPFLKYLKNNLSFNGIFNNIPSLRLEVRDAFEATEGDEITIFIEEKDFINALNNELILSAIRLLNLRMMKKTGKEKEKEYRRTVSHCLDLSDRIIDNNVSTISG
ncbi:MAG: GIY-YIG nuclease family protein [Methylococcales bacterium]|nr:GIY-YIG nuclease family protein [Methylococcales bacterium]